MQDKLFEEKGRFLLTKLFLEAKKDGEINIDEKTIINATKVNISTLIDYVRRAWENKSFSDDEKDRIEFLIQKIEDDATTLATYDDFITKEEDSLLHIIRNIIQDFLVENY